MRSYSNEVMISFDAVNTTGDTTFSTAGTQVLPTKSNAALGANPSGQPPLPVRRLHSSQVLSVTGIVKTAGSGTISIGDGTTAARYGVITVQNATAANTSLQAVIALSEEGFRMGLNQADTLKETFTLTYAGTGLVVTGLKITVGYF